VLKSRRGLLAAGLTAAVVGSIGVVSTLNAGAEQIPAAPPPAVVPADQPAAAATTEATEAAPKLTPPATLPWGQRPGRVRTGRDGASSKTLKAAGLDAAAPDATGEVADEEYAPKGRSSRKSFLKSERTRVIPPTPPAVNAAADDPKVFFHYGVGSQAAVTEGAYANFTISKPALATEDYHTLAELSVQRGDGESAQIVEVGWNVDRVVNGDDDPHLFVFHWVDGKPKCYNGCGFVQYSKNIRPGDTLPQDVTKRFGIQYFDKAWWIAYDSEWVGYFPASQWTVDFSKSELIQFFGEVASPSATPCSDMGNGVEPLIKDGEKKGEPDPKAAKIGSVSYLNGPKVDLYVRPEGVGEKIEDRIYPPNKLSTRTFSFSGPGAC
jgi:hypothetical protein